MLLWNHIDSSICSNNGLNTIRESKNKTAKNNVTKSSSLSRSNTYSVRNRTVPSKDNAASKTTSASTTDINNIAKAINNTNNDNSLLDTRMNRASSISAAGLNKNLTSLSNKLLSNSVVIATNSQQQQQPHQSQYWEGPPAHFMLPTHAISCRSSRSTDRCPKACKGKKCPSQQSP